MSKPGTIYRISQQPFPDSDGILEIVDISDNDNLIDDSADAEVIDLIPGGDCIMCEVMDNDEDPFTVIKSQKLTLRVLTDNPINMNTFASGSDSRWSVHHYIGSKTLFRGFINMDDLQQEFMPDPNELILTATDSLGLLKEIPLTDFEGVNPVGEYPIGELLAMALSKTGLSLGIKAAFNIKKSGANTDISSAGSGSQHFFATQYLNAKTFEDEIGTCINCYDVIKRILGEEARIFQRQGYWWILRVDEIENLTRGLYITEFDESGQNPSNLGEITFEKEIGKDSPYTMFFSKEQTLVIPSRPLRSVELTHDYEFPKEIVENIDFERGDLLTDISDTEKTYEIADWVPFFSNTSSDDAPTTSIYTKRIFEDGYEKERYVVLEASSDFNGIMSSPIPVGAGDRFSIDVTRKMSADSGGSGTYRDNGVQLRLYGSDGTYWTYRGKNSSSSPEREWKQCTSTFRTNQRYLYHEGDANDDLRESVGLFDGEVTETPVAGNLRLIVYMSSLFGASADTHITNVSLNYHPKINGSHQKYKSQSQKVTQDTADIEKYRAKRETQVYITDSPRPLIKGALLQPLLYTTIFSGSVQFFAASSTFQISGYQLALFRVGQRLNIQNTTSNNITCRVTAVSYSLVGTVTVITVDETLVNETDASTTIQEMTFELADAFYNAAVFPSGPPDSTYIHPYSEIQVHDVFNQFAIDRRVFQAVIQGMDLSEVDGDDERNNAHLIHKWFFRDLTEDTVNRCFSPLSFNQNHRNQEWTATFREVDRFNIDKVYANRTFKYKT